MSLERRVVSVQGTTWPELELDEWVRSSWPARRLTEANGSDSSYSDGTLMLGQPHGRTLGAGPR